VWDIPRIMFSETDASWTQAGILLLTALAIAWYTFETRRLGKEMVRQNEISLRPLVLPTFAGNAAQRSFELKNCGTGCALNVRISPIPIALADEMGLGPAEVRFAPEYYMAAGEDIPTPVRVWAAGQPTRNSPFDNWFFPQYPGGEITFAISFDDVEGGSYTIPVTVHAEQNPAHLPRQVTIGSVRKMDSERLEWTMNARRGLFQLWVIFAVLFVIVAGVVSSSGIRKEFRKASVTREMQSFTLDLPVDCLQARGKLSSDYTNAIGHCWYEIPKFRALYPEYKDLNDDRLSELLYGNAGIPLSSIRPWTKVMQAAGLAIAVPIAMLLIDWSLIWAFSGFRPTPKSKGA
jgi:hypothetical protein